MQKLHILIVEDGRSQREMLRDFLISEGHRVMEAENGEAFDVAIPAFSLDTPGQTRTLN